MKITLLCSDKDHPVNSYLKKWVRKRLNRHDIDLARKKSEASGGDILFLISCSEIINSDDRDKYGATLVLHASDLPHGRGWNPHIWEIIQGASTITLTLLEANDIIDSGDVWKKQTIAIPPHALWNEINDLLFKEELNLLDYAIENITHIKPTPQTNEITPTYYNKRTPVHSKIDPTKSIVEQFDLIRVCDPNRFPAHFYHLGEKYLLKIEKSDEQ